MNDQHRQPSQIAKPAVLRGEALWRTLGFKNEKAFQRARASGKVGVPLYPIPEQSRGVYALKADVQRYLARQIKRQTEEGRPMS